MAKVLVEESSLSTIASAIRTKTGGSTLYKPSQMAGAIADIPTGITPTGTINITQNGTVDVTQYASASVAVPNSYGAGDEGKVVSNGMLVAQTARSSEITQNGTYDTTDNNSVTVNVSGGGGTNILNGTSDPISSQGNNGDIYLKCNQISIKLLDYVESTGGQWLSTNHIPKNNERFVMDIGLVSPYNSYDTPFGARGGSDMFVAYNGGTFRYVWGSSSANVGSISNYYGQRVQMILDNSRAAVEQNGSVLVEKTFSATANSNVPMGIFTLQNGSTSDMGQCRAKGKLYEFLIYENDLLTYDYVPCLDENNIPCICDVMHGTCHYNLGSGSLSYGTVQQETIIKIVSKAFIKVSGEWQDLIGTDIAGIITV